jgi:hypothetical protein
MNNCDSAAMWKCYAEHNDGIAIQTTVGALKKALSKNDRALYLGTIQYIDYENFAIPENNAFYPFTFKRRSFEHERELRLICTDSHLFDSAVALPSGIGIPVDLDALISKVYISPTCADWIKTLVISIIGKSGLSKEVVKSDLNETGLW